jgi:Fur family ferric uptake transcriptional regulator
MEPAQGPRWESDDAERRADRDGSEGESERHQHRGTGPVLQSGCRRNSVAVSGTRRCASFHAMARRAEAIDAMRTQLRQVGLRATSSRIAVLDVLRSAGAPVSHAEVCDALLDRTFDRASIYRNLTDLVDAGLVHRTDVGDHVWRFELRAEKIAHVADGHAHFVCSDCGTIECLPTAAVSLRAVRGAPKSLGAKGVEVHVKGRCNACA